MVFEPPTRPQIVKRVPAAVATDHGPASGKACFKTECSGIGGRGGNGNRSADGGEDSDSDDNGDGGNPGDSADFQYGAQEEDDSGYTCDSVEARETCESVDSGDFCFGLRPGL